VKPDGWHKGINLKLFIYNNLSKWHYLRGKLGSNPPFMFRNYFTVAWRAIKHNKAFSLINIFGLTLGITCSLLILLWVQDESGIDKFHVNGNRLYYLYEREYVDGKIEAGYWTPGLLAQELKKNLPEIELATPTMWNDRVNFEANGKIIKQDGLFADSGYFRMFSFPLLQGSKTMALNSPSVVSISDKMARQFFGSAEAAVGKTIRYQNRRDLTVSAVFADPPGNTSQKFDFVLPWMLELEENAWLKDWRNNSPQTVVLLRPDANPLAVKAKLKKFLNTYNNSFTANFWLELDMQPYGEAYLHSNFVNGGIKGGRIEYVKIFSWVAIFVLIIACINFMNLTTARSAKRSKEIGIRKVAGAGRSSLVIQFLCEALFLTVLAVAISVFLVNLTLPFFNSLTGKQIIFPFSNPFFWIQLAGLTFITGLIAGSYPALLLSSFRPIRVLKGSLKFSGSSILFRKGLVVFQFGLSIVLIIGTIVITNQISYLRHAYLGFDRDNLVYIPVEGDLTRQYAVFKQEAGLLPGVKAVSRLSETPTDIGGNITGNVKWTAKDPTTNTQFTITGAGYDFVSTMHLTLLQGRDFSRDVVSDSSNYLINEEALKILRYKDPIGKPLELWGKKGVIVGVLKNFHLTSLHQRITPLIVQMSEVSNGGNILVRTQPENTKAVLAGLSKICTRLNPKFPFSSFFADEQYQKHYKTESIVGQLTDCFAVLAIFISCLGLLGLVMFTAEQRTKEIGIRKVLGASVFSLFTLLSNEFLVLVLIALFIASPMAWWATHSWLQGYAYQIAIKWWFFELAGAMVLVIALLTVSVQAVKTAMVNPVKSLHAE